MLVIIPIMIKKDNVYTIPLPGNELVLTKHLYNKEYVEVILLESILNKDKMKTIWWFKELYDSGFKHRCTKLVLHIYYYFFASLNPGFEAYMLKKLKEEHEGCLLGLLLNLIERPFSVDVFLFYHLSKFVEMESNLLDGDVDPEEVAQLRYWIIMDDKLSICNLPLRSKDSSVFRVTNLYNMFIKEVDKENVDKLSKSWKTTIGNIFITQFEIDLRLIMLSRVVGFYTPNDIRGKNTYKKVCVPEVFEETSFAPYINFRINAKYNVNDFKMLDLFNFKSNKSNKVETYNQYWLYHAAFSPIWYDRIKAGRGYVDYKTKQIDFIDDDYLESFYDQFNSDFDEQSMDIKERFIYKPCKWNWTNFYEQFKTNGLFNFVEEELCEMKINALC
jgi:hypothetical protein